MDDASGPIIHGIQREFCKVPDCGNAGITGGYCTHHLQEWDAETRAREKEAQAVDEQASKPGPNERVQFYLATDQLRRAQGLLTGAREFMRASGHAEFVAQINAVQDALRPVVDQAAELMRDHLAYLLSRSEDPRE